jgi:hypothetical protein
MLTFIHFTSTQWSVLERKYIADLSLFDISFLDGMTSKELDEDIKRKKERQVTSVLQANYPLLDIIKVFLDDIGVLVAMVTITLLAIIIVVVKVVLFEPEVRV